MVILVQGDKSFGRRSPRGQGEDGTLFSRVSRCGTMEGPQLWGQTGLGLNVSPASGQLRELGQTAALP